MDDERTEALLLNPAMIQLALALITQVISEITRIASDKGTTVDVVVAQLREAQAEGFPTLDLKNT